MHHHGKTTLFMPSATQQSAILVKYPNNRG